MSEKDREKKRDVLARFLFIYAYVEPDELLK